MTLIFQQDVILDSLKLLTSRRAPSVISLKNFVEHSNMLLQTFKTDVRRKSCIGSGFAKKTSITSNFP